MAYKCLECGHIFEEGEEEVWEERHGLDFPPYETMSGCPICRGSYEETEKCAICGGHFLSDELCGGVCPSCIDEHRFDVKTCLDVSFGEKREISIDYCMAVLLDAGDIEQILREYLLSRCPHMDCSRFINDDREWFADRLSGEVNKSENRKG
jgi:DNA-directed RNA polymerase subunit RPC12/RpoP